MSKKLDSVLDKIKSTYKIESFKAKEVCKDEVMMLDSPGLNFVLGGGWKHGYIYYLQGPESGGKTTLSTYIASQIQKKYTGKNTILYVDFEYSLQPSHCEEMGLNVDENFILLRPKTGEDGFQMITDLVDTGEIGLVVIDSITTINSKAQVEDAFKATFGGGAAMLSNGLRGLNPHLYNNKCSLILVSQERQNVGCVGEETLINWYSCDSESLKNTSIKDMFLKAFGLNADEMKVGKVYNVEEANIFVDSYDFEKDSYCRSKVINAVKKKMTVMYSLAFNTAVDNTIVRVSKNHKFAVVNTTTGKLDWVFTEDIFKNKKTYLNTDNFNFIGINLPAKLTAIVKEKADYPLDMEIEGTHCYFASGILSHNSMYGPDFKGTGGNAPKFYSSWMSRITRTGDITDPETKDLIGIEIRCRNTKNKLGIPKRDANLKVYFHSGINSDDEYLDYLTTLGIITRAGAYYSCEEWGMKVRGMEAVKDFLHKRPELYEKVKVQVNNLIMGHTILDDNLVVDENGEVIEDAWSEYSNEDLDM